MRSSSKFGLLEIAAQAIDAKCRRHDHFEVMRLREMMAGHHHKSQLKEELITSLMLSADAVPDELVEIVRLLEVELAEE